MKFRPLKAVLVFNPDSGKPEESPRQLVEILNELQAVNIQSRVVLIGSEQPVETLVQKAIDEGARMVIAAGGDGTIESLTPIYLANKVKLGIIPVGTRNNLALNLGIPTEIHGAVDALRTGIPLRIDIGEVSFGTKKSQFIELATLGLLSDLHSQADQIQHGDWSKIGELVSKVVASVPSKVKITLKGRKTKEAEAFVVIIANMSYLGPNIQIDPTVSFRDKLLDVFLFSDMGKLNLLSYAIRSVAGNAEDQSVRHYTASELEIETDPVMALRVDGRPFDAQRFTVRVLPKAITVMARIKTSKGRQHSAVADQKETAQ